MIASSAEIGGRLFEWGSRVYVMGIVNVTPDSFSGDGRLDPAAAVERALQLQDEGADLIDLGAESTRPGHIAIGPDEELRRLVPVLEHLQGRLRIPLSVDTWKLQVARAAVDLGASVINDVWGLQRSPDLASLAAAQGCALVLMHNQEGTKYRDLMSDVAAVLSRARDQAVAAGVPRERVILDPGIGFGKTGDQNLVVLRNLERFKALDQPLLVGTSRKSFLGHLLGEAPPSERLMGTTASITAAILRGADLVRVHDVRVMRQVADVALALR